MPLPTIWINMLIRKVTNKDIDNLKLINPIITSVQIKKRLNLQNLNKADFLILEDDGNPISFVFVKWNGKATHSEYPDMEDLYTRERYRNKGWGRNLIKEVESRAIKQGFSKIGLAVNPTINQNAKSLYEKLGYKHDGRDSYVDGVYGGVKDWVIDLEKQL